MKLFFARTRSDVLAKRNVLYVNLKLNKRFSFTCRRARSNDLPFKRLYDVVKNSVDVKKLL